MRRMLFTAGLVVVAGTAFVAASRSRDAGAATQDVRETIDRVIRAYGGSEVLATVDAYRMEGSIASRMRGHGRFTRLVVRPDRLDVVLDYGDHREVRLLRDGQGRRSSGDASPASVDGPLLGAMKLQAARSMVPWILDERRDEVRAAEPLEQGGRLFPGLELGLEDGLALRVYIDPNTDYVVQTQGLLVMDEMSTHFETAYADHRMVDGVLFAFREANFASGTATGWTTIETVTLNPPVTEDDESRH